MATINVYGTGKLRAYKKNPFHGVPLVLEPREMKLPDSTEYDELLSSHDRGFLRTKLLKSYIGIISTGGVDDGAAYAGLPWSPTYAPIANNLLAIERSVLECAYAGVSSIWIIATETVGTLLRERVGEYCKTHYHAENERNDEIIPIYYIPYHPHDAIFRPFTSWSILYTYWFVSRLMAQVSMAMLPIGAYVSFPSALYDPQVGKGLAASVLKEMDGANPEYPSLSFDGEAKRLGFFIDERCWYAAAAHFEGGENLPVRHAKHFDTERWRNAAVEHCELHYSLDKVFEDMVVSDTKVPVPWYYDIRTWEGYRSFTASNHHFEDEIYDKIGNRLFYENEAKLEENDGC